MNRMQRVRRISAFDALKYLGEKELDELIVGTANYIAVDMIEHIEDDDEMAKVFNSYMRSVKAEMATLSFEGKLKWLVERQSIWNA